MMEGAFSDNLLTLNREVGDIEIPINASGSEGSIPVENYGQEWLPEYKSVQMTCDFSTTLSYTLSTPFVKIHDTVFSATTSQSSDKIYFDKNQNRMVRCKYTSINSISLKESDYDEFTPCRYYRVFESGSQYNNLLSAILTAFSGVPFYRHMTFNIGSMCLYCEEEQCVIMTPSLDYSVSSPYELSFDTTYNLQVCGYNRNLSLEGSFEFEICGYMSGGYPMCPAFPARIVSAIPQDYAELHNLSN